MSDQRYFSHLRPILVFARTFVVVSFLLATNQSVVSQSTTSTDGATPAALQPGAPAGSYALSGFDNVNLYNGNLNFQLPLVSTAGRGGARSVVTLPIEQKWRVIDLAIPQWDGSVKHVYLPIASMWQALPLRYNPGGMEGRQAGYGVISCPDSTTIFSQTLTRLTFRGPDGTEYELRDALTNGKPSYNGACNNYLNPPSRGTEFISADGSAATFVSDTTIHDQVISPGGGGEFAPSGFLLLRDGTRFRINGGVIVWVRDRNGNKITYDYDSSLRVITITDSLKRVVSISYAAGGTTFDEIIFKGFGGTPRSIRVNYASMGSVLHSGSIQTYRQLFPDLDGSLTTEYNPTVIASVTLPNSQQYQFRYNAYGELARVVLPTGGAFEYDYAGGVEGGDVSGIVSGLDESLHVYRRCVERRVYPDGATGSLFEGKMTYSRPESTTGNAGFVWVKQYKQGDSNPIAQGKHYFHGTPTSSFLNLPTDYTPWNDGRQYKTESLSADGLTVLAREESTFQQRATVSWWPAAGIATNNTLEPPNDPRLSQSIKTIEPTAANLVSKQSFGYDDSVPFNNQNNVKEYDFGVGVPGSLVVRETRTTYVTTSSYTGTSVHVRSLPSQISIYDSAGIERARATSEYDNYTTDTNHAPLVSRSNISGFDSTFDTNYLTRGNVTASTQFILVNGSVTGSVSAFRQYDIAGNVVKVKDARGFETIIEYADGFGSPDGEARANAGAAELGGLTSYALATKVTNAANHIVYAQFDYYLGLPVDGEDANGVVASGYFGDTLDRPTQVKRAVGTSLVNQTTFAYDDSLRVITKSTDLNINNDNALVSKTLYDGLGRTMESRQYEGGTNYIVTQTQYDALSRPFKTSSPYRPWQSETAIWTTTTFDALGRVLTLTTPDSAVVTTSYSGNTVTVTDQSQPAGKKRKSVTDALGRLKEVYEDPLGVNYQTSYVYDVLDNLTTVSQGSQTRTFVYDSLKRLTSATNPESGTINYQYDNNGNLTLKTDARSISITFAYDALNRNTTVDYSNTGISPDITRSYDTASNGKGRLRESYGGGTDATGTTVEHTKIISYDALGRPLDQRQRFKSSGIWSGEYQTQRSYNLAGGVVTQTYPSGRSVSYSYDSAGRSSSFSGNLGDGSNRSYSTEALYSSLGGITKEKFGTDTPLYNKSFYNSRGQLAEIRVGTTYSGPTDSGWERGAIINHYSGQCWGACGGSNSTTSMTDNNGNLKQQDNWINDGSGGVQALFVQSYTYDSLNRLQRVTEGSNWQQEFVYDRWGNRTIHQTNTWGTGINKKDFTVNTANNRLGVPGGQSGTMSYDAAGNLTTDTYTGIGDRNYDAENRMTKAWGGNNQWQEYGYNADGQRTRRKLDGVETWQIYGMDGELLAEYASSGGTTSPQKEYGYRNGQLLVTAMPASGQRVNHAGATNGGVAAGSSSLNLGHTPNATTNGDRKGIHWGTGPLTGSGWVDVSSGVFPDWLQIDFNGSKTIDEVDVFTVQDDYLNPVEPTETMTFSTFGLTAYDVQYWNGSSWVTVTGGSITGNNKVWRKLTFSPINTSKIRVLTNAAVDNVYSRIVEVEAWGNVGGGPSEVNWLVADQLGTPRIILDKTGSLGTTKRHDYLPFGEELFAGVGGRTTALGYTADTIRQKFTRKERDNETGLDYFGARYYASMQGRFTGIDSVGPNLANPQTLNRYQYCLNNPLAYADRNGRYEEDVHRDLTYALALAAGFSTSSAKAIAAADQWTDDNPATTPMGMTPWGDDVRKRELYHFTTEARRNQMWGTFEQSGSLQDLGTFLHAQQDSFSHEGYGPRWGHGSAGHAPDKTFNNPDKADRMASDTLSKLIGALSILTKKGKESIHYTAMDWKTIEPMVQSFNKARTAEEKRKIINQIVQAAQYEHYRQEMERIKKKNIEADDTLRGKVRK